ncbi:winged helix-turn-helix domain-containing protein [Aeromonas hydrophila]|uniref:winged helix-turn-helix domain-containing protein n=1 Tax=Aeromonas hydrophila TaxID=644 RepID=UPI000332AE12|nr:winged helix-turn-helix domain-containing protein [Aeromonas hydrophila]AGM45130.1 transcriptional regulator [Aeromonas hydrophila ML09-119]EGX6956763.1 hypothetical protein [Aeromonas hydrophila]EGX6960759.1 hypothetical protein [Aeromonas hydrophila]MBC6398007.1 hypothetical protein [Aeromonas hydrophila]MCA4698759.1 winged helix-turn-helix domain-containing protein [Aeromonas hydrophila]
MNLKFWELDLHTGEIKYCDEFVTRLGASEIKILELLIHNSDNLVLKDSLFDYAWPEKIVSPNSLNVAIKKIRKVLSYDESLAYIETVHRKGYVLHSQAGAFRLINSSNLIKLDVNNLEQDTPAVDVESGSVNDSLSNKMLIERFLHEMSINRKKVYIFTPICMLLVFFAAFLFSSKKELICYRIDGNISFCGRFELDRTSFEKVKDRIKGNPGNYLYGYTRDLEDIKVYRRD